MVPGLAAVISLACAAGLVLWAGQPASGATRPRRPPAQLIRVMARSHSTSYARLAVYRRTGRHWVRIFGPWTARVGYNGIARPGAKREGDGKTPAGSYHFRFSFGVLRDPGVNFSYRRVHGYDVWDDDPSSPRYNEWVDIRHASPGKNPEPMDQRPAYDYGVVIAYNTRRVPGRGSAIFLHVGTDSATAGCVSLPRRELLRVLRWLRPRDHPLITITAR